MGSIFLFAFLTGIDNFQVAAAIGVTRLRRSRKWAFIAAFALFEAVMPLLGLLASEALLRASVVPMRWIGPLLLIACGVAILVGARRAERPEPVLSGRWALLVLPLGLSLDNLMAGAGLGALGYPVASTALVVGAGSAALGCAGMLLGDEVGNRLPARADALGAVLLLSLAGLALLG